MTLDYFIKRQFREEAGVSMSESLHCVIELKLVR